MAFRVRSRRRGIFFCAGVDMMMRTYGLRVDTFCTLRYLMWMHGDMRIRVYCSTVPWDMATRGVRAGRLIGIPCLFWHASGSPKGSSLSVV